jgi:hypothetical protein
MDVINSNRTTNLGRGGSTLVKRQNEGAAPSHSGYKYLRVPEYSWDILW